MIELFLTLVLNGQQVEKAPIDNIKFKSVLACQVYKARMNYQNTERLKFTCEKVKK